MKVELIDKMGTDLTPVNAARVSFSKQSKKLIDKDINLIEFLAKHEHELPFRHAQLQFRCSAPLFVARQLGKYQVGFSWSEESRRYISDKPSFWLPHKWRKAAKDKKQGSLDEAVDEPFRNRMANSQTTDAAYKRYLEIAEDLYKELLDWGVAPEQARMVLPQSMYINWIWTGSLLGFIYICIQRLQPDAQVETRDFAKLLYVHLLNNFPHSTLALTKGYKLDV